MSRTFRNSSTTMGQNRDSEESFKSSDSTTGIRRSSANSVMSQPSMTTNPLPSSSRPSDKIIDIYPSTIKPPTIVEEVDEDSEKNM